MLALCQPGNSYPRGGHLTGVPAGAAPEAMYLVTPGTQVNSGCCLGDGTIRFAIQGGNAHSGGRYPLSGTGHSRWDTPRTDLGGGGVPGPDPRPSPQTATAQERLR
ncbi:hypothetical protein EDC02_7869 [Micromonospora sp. Llam0]|uniref:hypothetical protein n=1 Tax=Micromonospora sp. Llam0 TaxID=2485143 RepID=UPI000FBA3CE2|nr:hypothetical protein [Micromonospora sp. Llam0]ROO52915.1 hypothetical protein EDC02_7869 [Micromonospora sp. Llam0]